MNAPVSVPKEFDRRNEFAFRQFVEGEIADVYRKSANVIIPYGFLLGFRGEAGDQVTFGFNTGNEFVLTVNDSEVLSLATSGDLDSLSQSLTLAWQADDGDQYTQITTEYSSAVDEVDGKLTGSLGFTVDVNGRIASAKLLSDGTLSEIVFTADSFQFYNGISDVALFSAGGGLVTVNGDLAVSGSIKIGVVRWPVALKPVPVYAADGGSIEWAGGAALSEVPDYVISLPNGVALAAGEAWEPPTIQSATTTGGTLRMKISTPGATASVTDTTDSAGGGGDPARVMAKADSADAYSGVYNFRLQGTINVVSTYDGSVGFYIHLGEVEFSPWFNDGGGWDEGPAIVLSLSDIGLSNYGASDITGSHSFDVTVPVVWANAIGQHGGNEWGLSHESGGSLTDFVSVQYIKQSTSGTRTGSPNGETATILVIPKNV